MTLSKSAQNRPYIQHGQITLSKALKTISNQDGWIEDLGGVGEALQAWKAAIVGHLGRAAEVSAMELSVIELATKTHCSSPRLIDFCWNRTASLINPKGNCSPLSYNAKLWPMPLPAT